MLVQKLSEKFLQFCTLTLAPIDADLIDFSMLTHPEKKWLYEYHQLVLKTFKDELGEEEKLLLAEEVQSYSDSRTWTC